MADPAGKARRLPPPRQLAGPVAGRSSAGADVRAPAGASPDLFEHFGVARERAIEPLAAIVAAQPCPGCGWLCPVVEAVDGDGGRDPTRCPLCDAPALAEAGPPCSTRRP